MHNEFDSHATGRLTQGIARLIPVLAILISTAAIVIAYNIRKDIERLNIRPSSNETLSAASINSLASKMVTTNWKACGLPDAASIGRANYVRARLVSGNPLRESDQKNIERDIDACNNHEQRTKEAQAAKAADQKIAAEQLAALSGK